MDVGSLVTVQSTDKAILIRLEKVEVWISTSAYVVLEDQYGLRLLNPQSSIVLRLILSFQYQYFIFSFIYNNMIHPILVKIENRLTNIDQLLPNNIIRLRVNDNDLDRLDKSLFDAYPNLEELEIVNNKLRSMDGIQYAKEIYFLDLSNNKIKQIECIKELKTLKSLALNHNRIQSLEGLKDTNLEYLSLSDNRLRKLGVDLLPTSLTFLNISNNKFYYESFNQLRKLKNLKTLVAENVQLNTLESLMPLSKLEYLYLHRNPINRIEYQLDRMDNLKVLYMNYDFLYKFFTFSYNIAHLVLDKPYWKKIMVNIDTIRAYGRTIKFKVEQFDDMMILHNEQMEDAYDKYTQILRGVDQHWTDQYTIENQEFNPNQYNKDTLGILTLINNNLTSIEPVLRFKRNLSILNINDNKLTDIKGIQELQELIQLNIEGNQVDSISDLRYVPDIKYLNIKRNPIKVIGQELDQFENMKELKVDYDKLEVVLSANLSILEQLIFQGPMEVWISRSGFIRLLHYKLKVLEHGLDLPIKHPHYDLIKITNQETEDNPYYQSQQFIDKVYGDCVICLTESNDMILQCGHLSHQECQDKQRIHHPIFIGRLFCPNRCHELRQFQEMYDYQQFEY